MNPTSILRSVLLPVLLLSALPACSEKLKTNTSMVPVPADAAPAAKSASSSGGRGKAIVAFCRKNSGRKVGDGQCWALANEAFKATGAQRVKGQTRVWGRQVNLRTESPQPGDILECDGTRFSDGSYTTSKHTAVIMHVHSPSQVRIAEQNFNNSKRIKERDLDISGIRSGRIYVYRPQ